MPTTSKRIEPKTIALIVGVVLVVALAVWQGARSLSPSANDVTYTPPVKPPPESARPPGFEQGGGSSKASEDDGKTGGG